MAIGALIGAAAGGAALNLAGSIFGGKAQRKAARRAAAAQRAALAESNKIIEAQVGRYQPTVEEGERAASLIRRALGTEEDTDYAFRRGYRDYRNFIGADRALGEVQLATTNEATRALGTSRSGNATQAILAAQSNLAAKHAGSYLQGLGTIQARGDQARESITQLSLAKANNALTAGNVDATAAYQRANAQVGMFQGAANAISAGIGDFASLYGAMYPNGLPDNNSGGGNNPVELASSRIPLPSVYDNNSSMFGNNPYTLPHQPLRFNT